MHKSFLKSRWVQIVLTVPVFALLCFVIHAINEDNTVPVQARPEAAKPISSEVGVASYYGIKYQGRPTASGESFDVNRLTAAHRTLPFGTRVKVTNLRNKRSVIVRINDRGPAVEGRIIDLSQAAAEELGMMKSGVTDVKVEVVP